MGKKIMNRKEKLKPIFITKLLKAQKEKTIKVRDFFKYYN
jgi:hypothetical protein